MRGVAQTMLEIEEKAQSYCCEDLHEIAFEVDYRINQFHEMTAISYNNNPYFIYNIYTCLDESASIALIAQDSYWVYSESWQSFVPLCLENGTMKDFAYIENMTETLYNALSYWHNTPNFQWHYIFIPSDKVYIDGDTTYTLYELKTIDTALVVQK